MSEHKEDLPFLEPKEELSTNFRGMLKRAEKQSYIIAAVDAGREVGINENDLKLEENLERELFEIIQVAREAGATNYSREDAIKALLQEPDYQIE